MEYGLFHILSIKTNYRDRACHAWSHHADDLHVPSLMTLEGVYEYMSSKYR